MRYVRVEVEGIPRWGVIQDGQVRTLRGDPYDGLLDYDGAVFPLADCALLPPCTPTKIVCVGKNYAEHAREMGGEPPGFPVLFLKGINTLNRPEGTVRAPGFVQRLDYEGELALVIRRRAKDVRAEDVAQYILGYTCLNDITARDVQRQDGQWTRGKSMDGFCPVGPWVSDEVDPGALELETRLNGAVVQRGNTGQFLTQIPQMLAFITASMTLEPGDVVATGTPAGIGPMAPGDVVEVEVKGIGTLRNFIL
ncbi:MAG TPA: fumarylacetoacetate hydrolase family protein [Candidatus Enterenecus merdae]|nr:fumarylacetoacetate hydrolase family protein [Candidatus Enterenecus merdae]